MNSKTPSFASPAVRTEMLVIDGISVRLNFSNKQNSDAFENIRKALLQTNQMGKKIAGIQ